MRSAECGCGLVTAGYRTRDGYLKRIRETQEDEERCNTKTERRGKVHSTAALPPEYTRCTLHFCFCIMLLGYYSLGIQPGKLDRVCCHRDIR